LQKGQFYYDQILTGNYVVYDIDATKWDASVPDQWLDALDDYYMLCGWTDRTFLDTRKKYKVKKQFKSGCEVSISNIGRFVASGTPDTYIGNSLMNLVFLKTIVEKYSQASFASCKLMICGDDALLAVPVEHKIPDLAKKLSTCGMEFEVEEHNCKDITNIKFCSGVFAPTHVGGKNTLCHVPFPHRVLGKTGHLSPESMQNISSYDFLRCINYSCYHAYQYDPIMSVLFENSVNLAKISHAQFTKLMMKSRALSVYRAANIMVNYYGKLDVPSDVVTASLEFWQKIYPNLSYEMLLDFSHRGTLEWDVRGDLAHALTNGLYPIPNFKERIQTKLQQRPDGIDSTDPFISLILLEEKDSYSGRLLRAENERIDAVSKTTSNNPPILYPAANYNDLGFPERIAAHHGWNKQTAAWSKLQETNVVDSYYLSQAWENPSHLNFQFWDGREDLAKPE